MRAFTHACVLDLQISWEIVPVFKTQGALISMEIVSSVMNDIIHYLRICYLFECNVTMDAFCFAENIVVRPFYFVTLYDFLLAFQHTNPFVK